MRPLQLSFSGPLTFSESELRAIQNETCSPGIFIWGFQHPQSKKFIPYSVEKAGQSVHGQLTSLHKNIFDLQENTIKWLSEDYLFGLNEVTPFYNDKKFPCFCDSGFFTGTQHLPLWYSIHNSYFDDKFIFLNNHEFLKKKYPDIPGAPYYPVSILDSSIYTILPYIGALQFCYTTVDNEGRPKQLFEFLQAYIRYMLKGKTTGSSLNYGDMYYFIQNDMLPVIIRNIRGKADPIKYLFKDEISLDFPGY